MTVTAVHITSAEDFARQMRRRRVELGLTQSELASRIGKSSKWVSEVERGRIMPTLPSVLAVARALAYSVSLRGDVDEDADFLAGILGER